MKSGSPQSVQNEKDEVGTWVAMALLDVEGKVRARETWSECSVPVTQCGHWKRLSRKTAG